MCRFACGFETNWPAALGRHESSRHRAAKDTKIELVQTRKDLNGATRAQRQRTTAAPVGKFDRLLEEVRGQQEELLQALKKMNLLVLADRDLRSREAEQIKADLSAVYGVLERNRQAREQRLATLIR